MIGYFVSIILLIIGCFLHWYRKTWISPDVLFCYEWAIITFLASLRLFGLYEAKGLTWLIILIGSLSFIAGVLKAVPKRARAIEFGGRISSQIPFIENRTFWLLLIILYVFSFQDFMQSLAFLQRGYGLDELRRASFGIDEISGYQRNTSGLFEIFGTIKGLLRILLVACGIHYFIINPLKNYLYLIGVLGFVMIESFASGGRFGFAYLIVEIFVGISIFGNVKRKLGTKFLGFVFIGILLYLIVFVSMERGWESEDFSIKYYRYICGNVVFLDKQIGYIDRYGILSILWSSLYGFWSMCMPVLHVFGIPYPEGYLNAIKDVMVTQNFVQIGEDLYTNAFITPFYHLYADCRIPGVILGMFVFGFFSGKIYRRMIYNMNGRNIVYYLIVCQMLFKTLSSYPFVVSGYVFIIIFFLLYKKPVLTFLGRNS